MASSSHLLVSSTKDDCSPPTSADCQPTFIIKTVQLGPGSLLKVKPFNLAKIYSTGIAQVGGIRENHVDGVGPVFNTTIVMSPGQPEVKEDVEEVSSTVEKQKEKTNVRRRMANYLLERRMRRYGTASPDELLNGDGLVEIKCPSSARDLTPNEAIKNRKITFWSMNKLHVTKTKCCVFVLWSPKGTRVERIEADTEFWQNKMLPKLEKFYKNCILPELIDPRVCRSMPIRNPTNILNAANKAVHKKTKIVDNEERGEGEEEH